MTTHCVLYARISLDKRGEALGVDRQLEDCRTFAKERGWQVVGEFTDNDISAHNGATRPGYERLMAEAGNLGFEQVVIWQLSRIWRRRVERAQAIDRLGRLQVGIACVRGPSLDLTTAYGRGLAEILGAFDSMESEVKSERITREAQQRAERGLASSFPLYGWRRLKTLDTSGRVTSWHDEEDSAEAGIVREIVDRLLAGESLHAITRDLNQRKVPTPFGHGTWAIWSVRRMAIRPANIAQRVYHGRVIGPAAWPAIVPEHKHASMVSLMASRVTGKRRIGRRLYMLSGDAGMARCAVCKAALGTQFRHGTLIYRCGTGGCTSAPMRDVDDYLSAHVIERLSLPDAARLFAGDDTATEMARQRVQAVRARLDTAARMFSTGDIDGPQLRLINQDLRRDLKVAEAEEQRSRPLSLPAAADALLGPEAEQAWEALDHNQRRSVLELLRVEVELLPRGKGTRGFKSDHVKLTLKPY
jgi:site-specific DNA recombinase